MRLLAGVLDRHDGKCSRTCRVRVDYVASQFHLDGPKVRGRSLLRHLRQEHEVTLLGAIVEPGSSLLGGQNSSYCRVEGALNSDIIFFEGGWPADHGVTRARLDPLIEFAQAGGLVVIADLDRNQAERAREDLSTARHVIGVVPRFAQGVRYLHDEATREVGNAQRFFTSEMRVSDWLAPALEGIDSLLVWGPVELDVADGIAASGHLKTRILVLDEFADEGFPWPWACVRAYGKGHIVVIGAQITGDPYVEACPDNARWISNLLALLADRAHENRTWAADRPASRPTRNLSELLERDESVIHERKGSFLTPLERPETTDQIVVQLAVLKAIAALTNTDGGNLVIGQDDHGSPLGLAEDFKRLRRKQDRDEFALKLVEFVDQRLSRNWVNLGLRLDWLTVNGVDVAVIEVPRSKAPVWANLTQGKGGRPDTMLVRSGPRSTVLDGPELGEWLVGRG